VALVVKSFVFEDPSFHDSPTVENDEGTRQFVDQIRSPMQKKIAVIMKGSGAELGKTIVKVIRNDGTEQYEVLVDGDPQHWSVNDYGEVLLHVTENSTEKLKLLSATGEIKWTIDVSGLTVRGIALGTDYAIAFVGDKNVRFYSTADGSLVNEVVTNAIRLRGPFLCSYDGYWGVCNGDTMEETAVFVSADGSHVRWGPGERAGPHTTDAYASLVGTAQGYIIFRSGENMELGDSDDRVWVAPSGDYAMLVRNQQIELYSIWKTGYALVSTTPFADGQSGCIWADLSFYGKYALILHNTNDVCVYDLKNATYKDKLHNPLGSRPVIVCAD